MTGFWLCVSEMHIASRLKVTMRSRTCSLLAHNTSLQVNFLLPGHGWTGSPAHEEGGAERSTRRWSLGEIPGYLQEIQARGSQRQTPNSNPPDTPTLINKFTLHKICFL
jgi:hypothetical protein